jgi:hypothetical protein
VIHTLAHVVVAGALSLVGLSRPDAVDDQQRVSDALASSSLRMLEAGFWSVGPGTQDDDFVSACLGDVDAPGQLAPVPGEVARGVSNVYLYQPDADGSPEDGELVTVAIVAVDAGNEATLDWFVVLLGDDDTASCRRDEFLRARELDPNLNEIEATVEADAARDLGIGDGSARLDLHIVFSRPGDVRPVRYTHVVGRAGRNLIVIRSATFGAGPFSGFDPEEELAAIAAELAAT